MVAVPPASQRGAVPPGLRSEEARNEERATREGGAVKGERGGGRGPAGERGSTERRKRLMTAVSAAASDTTAVIMQAAAPVAASGRSTPRPAPAPADLPTVPPWAAWL